MKETTVMMESPGLRTGGDQLDAFGARRGGRESVIDNECYFEGTFRTPGNLRIEGTYQGVIECHGTLLIAESGRVQARIVAGNLTVAGQLQGEAQCESRFELLKTGQVSGSVGANAVVVHDGAFFEGDIRMGGARATTGTTGARQPEPPRRRPVTPEPAPAIEETATMATAAADGDGYPIIAPPDEPATEPPAPRSNGRGSGTPRDPLTNRSSEN
jgi:cytoskeletal protein CcmA (bactofilin family)